VATHTTHTRTCDTCPDDANSIAGNMPYYTVQRCVDKKVGEHDMTYAASKSMDLCEKCAEGLGLATLVPAQE
jgi:hypothetical protein